MAQLGSCCRIPSKVRLAYRNQYECSMATPRSNSACTLGSQEVGKLTLPSFSSCWLQVLLVSVAAMRLTTMIRCLLVMAELRWKAARSRTPANAPGALKKNGPRTIKGEMPADGISAAAMKGL